MLEKFSSLDYKFQAAIKLFDGFLEFADQEIKQRMVRKTMHYLNKKYLRGSYSLPLEECDTLEILKNAANLERIMPVFLQWRKDQTITLSNSKAREKYNSSSPMTQEWLCFMDAIDEYYLSYDYAELALLNSTEKDRLEWKKDLL